MEDLQKNSLDPFKFIFDIFLGGLSLDGWINKEKVRQIDKTVTNRIGEFHQKILGKVEGWKDLGRGDPLGVDLKKDNDTIFIEIKNKHNTVKGEDHKSVFDKLKKVLDKYPEAIAYYAYIIPKKPSSGERVWKPSRREPDERIKEAWGHRTYEIVTGDKKSLEKVWSALPLAIKDITKSKHKLSQNDERRLIDLFNNTIKD